MLLGPQIRDTQGLHSPGRVGKLKTSSHREDYTLTYDQLVEIGAEWLAENN